MHISKIILVLLSVGALALVPTVATAQPTFIFDVTSGNWHTRENWDPTSGPPQAGDRAIIPSGKTCTIDTANQEALVVEVIGTLIIKGKTLSMLPTSTTSPSMKVNGTVKFEKPGQTTPKLIHNEANIPFPPPFKIFTDNAGTLVADGAAGHEGIIEETNTSILDVQSGVTIKGSISVDGIGLINDGLFLVDNASDTMFIGGTSVGLLSVGSGTFEVSDGDMFIRRLKPNAETFTGKLIVSGGTMTFTTHVGSTGPSEAKVEVSGGTLLFEADWQSLGGLDFTGGTIKVAANETATFE